MSKAGTSNKDLLAYPMGTPPTPTPSSADEAQNMRDYILDMIEELAKMAHDIDELEIAIHLAAILEAARSTERRRNSA